MAIVNALKFSDMSGAILSDEESWKLRRRRVFYLDNLSRLTDENFVKQKGIEMIYGGVGFPNFHGEIIENTKKIIKNNQDKITTTEDIGKIVLDCFHMAIRRRVNDRLKLLFNLTVENILSKEFTNNGNTYSLKNKDILKESLKFIRGKTDDAAIKAAFDNNICLIGYDKKEKFRAFCIKGKDLVLSVVSGGFESLGMGKYAAGRSFARYLNTKYLAQRRGTLPRAEGMLELIRSGLSAWEYFGEVGGYLHIVYINGASSDKLNYLEINDDRSKLAMEIVKTFVATMIPKSKAIDMIDRLIFNNESPEKIEEELFNSVDSKYTLGLLLRGYKIDTELERIENQFKGKLKRR